MALSRLNEGLFCVLDDIHDIDDWSQITVWALIDRIRKSSSFEHAIYRETEIDELWRNLDIASATAVREGRPEAAGLLHLKAVAMAAHDLIGVDGNFAAAADLLTEHFVTGK